MMIIRQSNLVSTLLCPAKISGMAHFLLILIGECFVAGYLDPEGADEEKASAVKLVT